MRAECFCTEFIHIVYGVNTYVIPWRIVCPPVLSSPGHVQVLSGRFGVATCDIKRVGAAGSGVGHQAAGRVGVFNGLLGRERGVVVHGISLVAAG